MKTIALIIVLFGCGFDIYSQHLQFSLDDISLPARSERHRAVHDLADSCLRYAKSLEKSGELYRPKDYFTALKSIDSLSKLYNVTSPVHIISDLKLIMCHGRNTIPSDLKEEVATEWSKLHLPLPTLKDFVSGIAYALGVIIFVLSFVWFLKNQSFIIRTFKQIIRSIKRTQIECPLVFNLILLKFRFYYLARPPTKFSKIIDHVPLFVSLLNLENLFYFTTNKNLKWNIQKLLLLEQHPEWVSC